MKQRIFDRARGKHLVLTPEESVRQRVLDFLATLVDEKLIAQEYPIDVNGQSQRADIVVFSSAPQSAAETALCPLLLVECKAHGVKISAATLAQAHRYNTVLRARYVMLTNGTDHFVYELTPDGNYLTLSEFPDLS